MMMTKTRICFCHRRLRHPSTRQTVKPNAINKVKKQGYHLDTLFITHLWYCWWHCNIWTNAKSRNILKQPKNHGLHPHLLLFDCEFSTFGAFLYPKRVQFVELSWPGGVLPGAIDKRIVLWFLWFTVTVRVSWPQWFTDCLQPRMSKVRLDICWITKLIYIIRYKYMHISHKWINEWINKWTDGWMDGWIKNKWPTIITQTSSRSL